MSRINLEDSVGLRFNILSAIFGGDKKQLSADYVIPTDFPPLFHFLDPNGSDRDVTLPPHKSGLLVAVSHTGSANILTVKDTGGTTIGTISQSSGTIYISDGANWWKFTETVGGDYLDPTEITSPDSSITTTVDGNTLKISVNESNVDHNSLQNYSANRHVDHTGVSITAGIGLTGGGDISATRTISLDINGLSAITPVLGDSIAFYDLSGTTIGKCTFTTLNGILDHNSLVNYSANRHIDHTAVSIVAGTGMSGGGDISSSRTLNLDINGLTADTPVSGDFFVFYDISGTDTNKVSLTNLATALGVIATSGTSILKGNGSGGFSNAVSGTDYAPATSGTAILKGSGSGGFSSATAGTDYLAPSAIGVTVQGYDANTAKLNAAQTFSSKQTFTATVKVQQMLEKVTITAGAPSSTYNFDWGTQAIEYLTSNTSTNWTLNVRSSSGASLDSVMATGEAITLAYIVTNGGTAYRQTALTIDGNSVTAQWLGAAAPSAGTVSKRDTYTITIIKTGSATFVAHASFASGN